MEKIRLNIQLFAGSVSIQTIDEATNINTNQSTFTIAAKMTTSGSTYNNDNAYMTLQWKYASASSWTSLSKQTFGIGKNTSKTKSWTLTLDHNADGTLENINFRVKWYITDSTNGTTGTTTKTPTTIPRASEIESVTGTVTPRATNVTFTPKSTAFKYKIGIKYGTYSTITNLITPNTTDSYTQSVLITNDIFKGVNSQTINDAVATLYTYQSDGTTLVGSNNKTISGGIVLNQNAKPTISISNLTEADTTMQNLNWGIYVQNKSKLSFKVTTGYNVLQAPNVTTTANTNNQTFSFNGYTNKTFTTNSLNSSGSKTISVTATDSRNRSASASTTYNVVAYSSPTINTAQVQRCTSDGTIDKNGEYCYFTYNASISSCDNHNKTNAEYKIGYRVHNTGSYTYITLATNVNSKSLSGVLSTSGNTGTKIQFDANTSYDIQFYVKDSFINITNIQLLDTGFDLLNFNASGKAMAIGKVSEAGSNEELLEIALPTQIDDLLAKQIRTDYSYLFELNAQVEQNRYYKLCKIPATSVSNAIQVNIQGSIGSWKKKGTIDLQIRNRGGLQVFGNYYGEEVFDSQTIVIYEETDGSHTIYLKNITQYAGGNSLLITQTSYSYNNKAQIYTDKSYTTSPSGSLVWTSTINTMGNNNAPVVLYQNSSGTQSNITLSDNYTNYKIIEIFYRNAWICNSAKVDVQSEQSSCSLTIIYATGTASIDFHTGVVSLSGNTISFLSDRWRVASFDSTGTGTNSNKNIYITKVIGYK